MKIPNLRLLRVILLIGVFSGSAQSSKAKYYAMGPGVDSCASWLKSSQNELVGASWLLGFWTGLNAASTQLVGEKTNVDGRVGEVKKICTDRPSMSLVDAAFKAYAVMRNSSGQD